MTGECMIRAGTVYDMIDHYAEISGKEKTDKYRISENMEGSWRRCLGNMAACIRKIYRIIPENSEKTDVELEFCVLRLVVDCLQKCNEAVLNPENLRRTIIWRTGVLIAMKEVGGTGQPPCENEYLIELIIRTISWNDEKFSKPRRDVVEKMICLAEENKFGTVNDLAKAILRNLGYQVRHTNRRQPRKLVCAYGHPIDSGIVKVLDTPVINGMFRTLVDLSTDAARGQMLASSIPVNENNYPELNEVVNECVAKLKIKRPYVVVTCHISGINAMTFGSDEEPYIVITSLLVKVMSKEAMRFVIGHECGHIAMGHVIYHTAAAVMGTFSQGIPVIGPMLYSTMSFPLNAWSRRSEITADRAGFLCCGDLETAKKALLQIESAYTDAENIDLDSYMANSEHFLEKNVLRKLGEYGANHPLTSKRIRALELFGKSRLYYVTEGREVPKEAISDSEFSKMIEQIVSVL